MSAPGIEVPEADTLPVGTRGHVAIDLDGTLVEWNHADGTKLGPWIEGAEDALRALTAAGIGVIVHSCRATWIGGGGSSIIADALRDAGFQPNLVKMVTRPGTTNQDYDWQPVVYGSEAGPTIPEGPPVGVWIGEGKPIAWAYIDDRGVHFETWSQTMRILNEVLLTR